jgi:cytochrome c1
MSESKTRRWIYTGVAVVLLLVASVALVLAAGFRQESERRASRLTGGSAEHGKAAIAKYGCGGCHIIPGITGDKSYVGPNLESFPRRTYIGGVAINQPETLVRWIVNPKSIDAKTAMPNLGVTEKEARDIATYLYSIQ